MPGFGNAASHDVNAACRAHPRTAACSSLAQAAASNSKPLPPTIPAGRSTGSIRSRHARHRPPDRRPLHGPYHAHRGTIEAASEGPFAAAVCLLTFHFIARENRLPPSSRSAVALGLAPLSLLAHISFPRPSLNGPGRSRHIAFAGGDLPTPQPARPWQRASPSCPEEEESMLNEAGFETVEMFYAALSFRGWIAYAP